MTALISLGPVASAGAPTLTVTGGLHQGSSLVLDQPVYTLGADLAADLVLSDPGVAGLHVRLRFEGGQVAVEALGGDVLLSANVRIPQGSGHRARLPLQLRIGTMIDDRPYGLRDFVIVDPAGFGLRFAQVLSP